MCVLGPSSVQECASNAQNGAPLREVSAKGRSKRCILSVVLPHPRALTKHADLPESGCGREVLETPKYCPFSGCHRRPPRPGFVLDAWWESYEIHRDSPRGR